MNITDQLNACTSKDAAGLAFGVINTVQTSPPGQQVAAIALVFVMMCERFKVKPQDVLNQSTRRLFDAFNDGNGATVRALKEYIHKEL